MERKKPPTTQLGNFSAPFLRAAKIHFFSYYNWSAQRPGQKILNQKNIGRFLVIFASKKKEIRWSIWLKYVKKNQKLSALKIGAEKATNHPVG